MCTDNLEDSSYGYEINFNFSFALNDDEERFCIRPFRCNIDLVDYDMSSRSQIGRAYGVVAGSDAPYEIDVFDACDAESQDLCDAYLALHKPNGDLLPRVAKALDLFPDESPSWLYMSRMEIDKAHRGLGLGLLAVLAAIKLAEVQVVFCKPFPLERDEKEPKKILDSRIDKLASHWKKLGFCEIGTKRNRWLGLSTAFRLPTLDELKQEGHIKI